MHLVSIAATYLPADDVGEPPPQGRKVRLRNAATSTLHSDTHSTPATRARHYHFLGFRISESRSVISYTFLLCYGRSPADNPHHAHSIPVSSHILFFVSTVVTCGSVSVGDTVAQPSIVQRPGMTRTCSVCSVRPKYRSSSHDEHGYRAASE